MSRTSTTSPTTSTTSTTNTNTTTSSTDRLLHFPLGRRGDVLPEECAALRAKEPVARVRTMTGDTAWLVSSYALAKRVLEDDRFSLKDTAAPDAPRQYALTLVLVLVEGANFDPEVFTDPERLDLDREVNPHLSFGAGRHFCPATGLGRAHAETALSALVERLPGLRLAVPPEQLVWRTGFIKRLPERLPVLW
ncbi:hypothetical protein [Streptomyces sp. NPDC059994]|uniref:hypothetical protein n=1 Tax=Streptomyces sp. NPDC059994 TaxID=3347029 RepID=UPI0036C7058A